MKRIVSNTFVLFAVAVLLSPQARAESSWWASLSASECVVSDGKGGQKGDLQPETGNVPMYSAYYCSVDTVRDNFGASDVAGLEKYLASHFDQGKSFFESSGTGMNQWGFYEAGQYFFSSAKFDEPVAAGAYLAVAFYGDDAYRVFANDLENTENGHVVFDDAISGTAGAWKSVPEPSSGLLLLMGVAGLCLRRRSMRFKTRGVCNARRRGVLSASE